MAVVTSYTAERITELLSSVPALTVDQEAVAALVAELQTLVEQSTAERTELNTNVLPQLYANLAENDVRLADLNDNVLVDLQASLDANAAVLADISDVTIPNITQDLANNIQNVEDRPNVYVQDEVPTNPDDNDRYLVVGDSWFDSNDNNLQRLWNGVEWSTFNVDIPDLSLTVVKFKSSAHLIY